MSLQTSEPMGRDSHGFQSNRLTAGVNVSSAYDSHSTTTPAKTQPPSKNPRQVRSLAVPLTVPTDLERIPQWVCWGYDVRDGELTKPPIDVHTGGKAKTNSPRTWADLETALTYCDRNPDRVSGVGFCQQGTDVIGVDIDHCIDAGGIIQPQALAIVRAMNSYTEVSPSGEGLRIFARGVKPGKRERNGTIPGVELYDGASVRYLTFTGHHYIGTPLELLDASQAVVDLYNELWPDQPAPVVRRDPQPVTLEDADLLTKAMSAKNGARFVDLWHGRTTGYSSASEADYALVGMLLFWTAGDEKRVDQLFRQSDLWREKWDRKTGDETYGSLTIAKCAAGKTQYYTPQAPRPDNVTTAGVVVQPPHIADLWRILNAHIHHDGDHCPMCGRAFTEEWEVDDRTDGRYRLYRCKRADCLDWQTHRAKQLVAQSDMHLWPAHFLTLVPVDEYDRMIDRGALSRGDLWRGVAETNDTMFVASGFAIDSRSIATRLDALAPMLAERWLSRKPGSRLRNPKQLARAKRAAVACDAPVPAAVVASVPPEPKPTRRAAFGLVDMDYSQAHDFLAVLEAAGATVDHKRGRWSYLTADRASIAAVVTTWADVAGVGGRYEINTFRPESSQNVSISGGAPVVEVLGADLHPQAGEIARYMAARAVTNHGRQSG